MASNSLTDFKGESTVTHKQTHTYREMLLSSGTATLSLFAQTVFNLLAYHTQHMQSAHTHTHTARLGWREEVPGFCPVASLSHFTYI